MLTFLKYLDIGCWRRQSEHSTVDGWSSFRLPLRSTSSQYGLQSRPALRSTKQAFRKSIAAASKPSNGPGRRI
eukprot:1525762-Pyramimonas_sp.AAC.1